MNKEESKSLSGPIKLLQKSWKTYKANAKTFTLIMVFPVILGLIFDIIPFGFNLESRNNIYILYTIGLLLVYIPILLWSNTALYLCIVERFSDWKSSYNKAVDKIIPFFLIMLLMVLLPLSGIIFLEIIVTLFLLPVPVWFYLVVLFPGIIPYAWFCLAPFVYFEENKGVFSALEKSKDYIKGYWWSVFLRGLFIFFVYFVITILFWLITKGLGVPSLNSVIQIVLTPIGILYSFELYRELKAINSKD